ncbi:hypothetical protein AAFF_G00341170 [Aldrovandia affinis]|uniref:Uncharacterized protein n=1 Tax=Aldrovandia affinis TaxID=143900 RepID=A0AAD7SKL4_9TELE|nr:hypothetical protein AAFF_G00341170 [Aldrovandia affinis]
MRRYGAPDGDRNARADTLPCPTLESGVHYLDEPGGHNLLTPPRPAEVKHKHTRTSTQLVGVMAGVKTAAIGQEGTVKLFAQRSTAGSCVTGAVAVGVPALPAEEGGRHVQLPKNVREGERDTSAGSVSGAEEPPSCWAAVRTQAREDSPLPGTEPQRWAEGAGKPGDKPAPRTSLLQ